MASTKTTLTLKRFTQRKKIDLTLKYDHCIINQRLNGI